LNQKIKGVWEVVTTKVFVPEEVAFVNVAVCDELRTFKSNRN